MKIGVVGAGIFGLAAALELRQRGHTVTLVEQGRIPNPLASSTDVSKTLRRLYGDDLIYLDLAERAAVTWRAWHERLSRAIYHQVGHLYITSHFEPGAWLYDSWRTLAGQGATLSLLSPAEVRQRFPQFHYEPGDTCLYDPWPAYLASGQAVADLADLARAEGVTVWEETPVTALEERADGVGMVVADGPVLVDRVVVATGAWLERLAPALAGYLRITRQQMAFIEPADTRLFAHGAFPVWAINESGAGWYGHPLLREGFVKLADNQTGPLTDIETDRAVTPVFLEEAWAFVTRRIPALAQGRLVGGRACLYPSTPDGDFLIDWAPGSRRVLIAGGGGGHGFKFGGSIGPVIADALEERANPLGDRFRLGDRLTAFQSSSVAPVRVGW